MTELVGSLHENKNCDCLFDSVSAYTMNPYQSYEYSSPMNHPSCPIKEEPLYDFVMERPDAPAPAPAPQPSMLPYMSSFGKHATSGIQMYYPQIPYDYHPLILNQRRRSSTIEKYPEHYDSYDQPPNFSAPLLNLHFKDNVMTRYKPRQRGPGKRKIADQNDSYNASSQLVISDGSEGSPDSNKSRKTFNCQSCCKFFKFQTSLLRHNNKVHNSKYQCPTCSRVFSRQAYLDVHTSKQGNSCYLDQSLKLNRRSHMLPISLHN